MKSLILLACLLLAALPSTGWTQEAMDRNSAFAQVQSNAGQLTTGLYAGELPPDEFKSILYSLTEDLYSNGFISLAQMNSKKAQVDECLTAHNTVNATGGLERVAAMQVRSQKCGDAVNFQPLQSATPACVPANGVLAGAQCCAGLVAGGSASLEKSTAGKKTNEACTSHTECASKQCEISEGATSGMCSSVMTCFPTIPAGSECSPENTNCVGSVCRSVDIGLGGVTCKPLESACSSADECCSSKCTASKCVEKFMCEKCTVEGVKPGPQDQCCRGLIKDIDGMCTLEMPPFILPTTSIKREFWKTVALNLLPISSAFALPAPEVDGGTDGGGVTGSTSGGSTGDTGGTTGSTTGGSTGSITNYNEQNNNGSNTSQGVSVNDDALTEQQLDFIEGEIGKILEIKDKEIRKQKLLAIYAKRKEMTAANAAAVKSGKKIGKTFTQEEYVKRYNIPAITPKERSNVERCEFNTVKDNWIDASNLMRNADLFVRSFETSFSGIGTKDMWHLPDASFKPHKENLYTRSKNIMLEVRDNRNYQRDQLKYLDLMMACQCIYTFGPDKFDADKQSFFFSMCTGRPDNKICRDGAMRDSLKIPDSAEPAYVEGQEFPNYVEMYLRNLEKMVDQKSTKDGDINNVDSSAAGINHEEVLVRWLRMRSCNQVDVFMDVENVETGLQTLVEELHRAKLPNPNLTSYWNSRLQQMSSGGVPSNIVDMYRNDKTKDTWFRGYVHTESKVHSWTKKTLKFLLFLILALLMLGVGLVIAAVMTAMVISAVVTLVIGVMVSGGGGGSGSFNVIESFSKDFPNVVIEDRLVEKKSCGFLGLFYCKTFYRILHWPASSNNPGIQSVFPWTKREERTCDQTYQLSVSWPGVGNDKCSGPFKANMCARSFFRPMPDSKIANKQEFAPWKEVMRDKMLMDPVMPEFFAGTANVDNGWVPALNAGFMSGCNWVKGIGKAQAKVEDKAKFFPDFDKWIDTQGNFKPEYQWDQARIDAYKQAVQKYALCKDLYECGAKNYDGKHPSPWGHGDVFETKETAELWSNYVYQLHFNWRHMSGQSGIGYPLSYAENYYTALLHNIRLLTTLSIRRGIELDDAYNKYAEDLAIRRSRYQITGKKYGLNMGQDSRSRVIQNPIFNSLKAMGFPLSANFSGLPSGSGLGDAKGSAGQGSASGSNLSGIDLNVLNAARRHAGRVASDNAKWKNYLAQTKGNAESAKRLASASKFFGQMNSPLAAVPSMAKPGDTSSYSGIGGNLTNGLGARNGKLADGEGEDGKQKYGAVDSKNGAASAGAGGAGGFGAGGKGDGKDANGNGMNDSDYMNGLMGAADSGAQGGASAGANGEQSSLSEAAKVTGMKEGELANMLESADKNRKNLASGEEDSLFQKVSKAYLRNLDRVLVRKKSAEKPVKKEAGDPEKDEIKKIFNQ